MILRLPAFVSPRLALVLLVAALCGCAPTEPLDTKINASSSGSFLAWRSQMEPRLTTAQRGELVEALQELKLAAMLEAKDALATGLDEQVRARIDGRPLRELYLEAWNARLQRLAPERATLREALAHNGQLRTVNSTSANYLALRVERQTQRLAAIDRDWATTEARLAALGVTLPLRSPK